MEKVWYMKYTETIVNYVYLSFIKGMLTKFILHGIQRRYMTKILPIWRKTLCNQSINQAWHFMVEYQLHVCSSPVIKSWDGGPKSYSANHRKSYLYYYRPPEGGRLFDMKVVSSYVFLRTYHVQKKITANHAAAIPHKH